MKIPSEIDNREIEGKCISLQLDLEDILALQAMAKAAELFYEGVAKNHKLMADERHEAEQARLAANRWWQYTFNLETQWSAAQNWVTV